MLGDSSGMATFDVIGGSAFSPLTAPRAMETEGCLLGTGVGAVSIARIGRELEGSGGRRVTVGDRWERDVDGDNAGVWSW